MLHSQLGFSTGKLDLFTRLVADSCVKRGALRSFRCLVPPMSTDAWSERYLQHLPAVQEVFDVPPSEVLGSVDVAATRHQCALSYGKLGKRVGRTFALRREGRFHVAMQSVKTYNLSYIP